MGNAINGELLDRLWQVEELHQQWFDAKQQLSSYYQRELEQIRHRQQLMEEEKLRIQVEYARQLV